MRSLRLLLPALLMLAVPLASWGEKAAKARPWTECDSLCQSLIDSIKANPETLVMRIEDALVIRREFTGEIVAAALSAVGSNPALREKVVRTAIHVAPEKTDIILYAAQNPRRTTPMPMVAEVEPEIEVRRPIMVGRRVREEPPAEEIRKAITPGMVAISPPEEIRRAVVPAGSMPPAMGANVQVRRAIRLSSAEKEVIRRGQVRSFSYSRPSRAQ
jgi:hypothetical protein